jgi:predicted metal-binding membrane protein
MAVARNTPATERRIILAGLTGVCVLAWLYVLYMRWGMEHMDAGAELAIMPRMTGWNAIDLVLVFAMWVIMMVAMMLPSAMPMILTFATAHQRRRLRSEPYAPTAAFVAGYLRSVF